MELKMSKLKWLRHRLKTKKEGEKGERGQNSITCILFISGREKKTTPIVMMEFFSEERIFFPES